MPQGGDIIYASDVTGPPSVMAVDGTNLTNLSNTSPSPGSPLCGVAFTMPRSNRVRITIGGKIYIASGTGVEIMLGAIVKAGDVIGSGGVVHDGLAGDPGCRIAVQGAGSTAVTGSASYLVSGLVVGALYNITAYHQLSGSTPVGLIYNRWVMAEPVS